MLLVSRSRTIARVNPRQVGAEKIPAYEGEKAYQIAIFAFIPAPAFAISCVLDNKYRVLTRYQADARAFRESPDAPPSKRILLAPWHDKEIMTPLQFKLIISHMALSETVIAAVRRCLVDNEPQAAVAAEMGMKPPQLSRAIRSVQEKYEKILEQYGWEVVQVVLPKELVRGVLDTEAFFLKPILKSRLEKKKARKAGFEE